MQCGRALALRLGCAFTETEWANARATLIEFATILRRWEKAGANESLPSLPLAA
jgi:hypothetical protein